MKEHIKGLLETALQSLKVQNTIPQDLTPEFTIERTRDASHGDFATNLAMMLAKPAKTNPRKLAQDLVDALPASDNIAKVEIAGPGFINLFLSEKAIQTIVPAVLKQVDKFGESQVGAGKKAHIEFVSANPTGPLHVGHGRGAAYGATLANLFQAIGFDVHREYYVNDAGRQMHILAASVWLRYLESCGESFTFPSNGYRGDYVKDLGEQLKQQHGDKFKRAASDVFENVPDDEAEDGSGDKDAHIDGIINNAQSLLSETEYRDVFDCGLNAIVSDIREDLSEFGVEFQEWFSERSLMENGALECGLQALKDAGVTYEKDGALWFKATELGDDKDRVLVRDNGQSTYFASDVAYHFNKFERGYDQVIDVLGADHHGYVPRIKAMLKVLGKNPDNLYVALIQFAILYRGKERVQMSTRSGSFVTLRELREEVGCDAARFFYVMRKHEQHMDFDLELAKSKSNENPMYYIQYAHARICSILRQLDEKKLSYKGEAADLEQLTLPQEREIMLMLSRYPEVLEHAALSHEPHQLAHYLRELANSYHAYYNVAPVAIDDSKIRVARVTLSLAIRQVIKNGLALLGVSAPNEM